MRVVCVMRWKEGLSQGSVVGRSPALHTTVREANDRGFRCIVLSDCCASYFPEFHQAGLAMIKAQGGIFGWVAASPSLLKVLAANS